jgi:hypothetical protein
MKGYWKDYLREVIPAYWRAFERTDTLVIVVFIVSGIFAIFGFFGGHADHPSAQIALAILLLTLFVLLVKVPYRLYADQRGKIASLTDQLARIADDRPFRFDGLSVGPWIRKRIPGPWTILTMQLSFVNVGDATLRWQLKEVSLLHEGRAIPITLPGEGKYVVHARNDADVEFDVPDLNVMLPAVVRVSFSAEYDNIPALRIRRLAGVLDCKIKNLVGGDYEVDIVEQREC